jgi:hypothetical protein
MRAGPAGCCGEYGTNIGALIAVNASSEQASQR